MGMLVRVFPKRALTLTRTLNLQPNAARAAPRPRTTKSVQADEELNPDDLPHRPHAEDGPAQREDGLR